MGQGRKETAQVTAWDRVDPEPLLRDVDGRRFYAVPDLGLVPSVTTVIRETLGKQWALDRWRADLGPEAADLVTEAARERGRQLHRKVERYLVHHEAPSDLDVWWQSIASLVDHLRRYSEPVLVEGAVWHPLDRYAGTPDEVVRMCGVLSVWDWKTSAEPVPRDRLMLYAEQLAAYVDAIAMQYAERPREAVVVVALPNRQPQVHTVDLLAASARWRGRLEQWRESA